MIVVFIDRLRPRTPTPKLVDAIVVGDPEEPRREGAATIEASSTLPDAPKNLLYRFLGNLSIAKRSKR